MRLYDRVDRIERDLLAAGIGPDGPLAVADLVAFDQYHYDGTTAVDAAIDALRLGPASRVLDVGSGIGGPARYVAATAGSAVTALELQPDLHQTASRLTARAGVSHLVEHVAGDILAGPPERGAYDAVISYLVFLHIPDRARLLDACAEALVADGRIFIEDFTLLREPDAADRDALADKLVCTYLPSAAEYTAQLQAAGFAEVELVDMSASWTAFTADRLAAFRAGRARQVEVHGADVVDGLDDFYATVADLYGRGVIGGARITAALPLPRRRSPG